MENPNKKKGGWKAAAAAIGLGFGVGAVEGINTHHAPVHTESDGIQMDTFEGEAVITKIGVEKVLIIRAHPNGPIPNTDEDGFTSVVRIDMAVDGKRGSYEVPLSEMGKYKEGGTIKVQYSPSRDNTAYIKRIG